MKLNRILLGGAAALALVAGPSIAANADVSAQYTNAGIQRSTAYYNTSLDRVTTSDVYNDGWGSRARWNLNAGGSGSKDNTGGAGSSDYGYPSFGSSTKIKIASCSVDNGIEKGCGAYTAYVNK